MPDKRLLAVLSLASHVFVALARAESVSDHAVLLSAEVSPLPPQILISWPSDPSASGYTVFRKSRDDSDWGTGTALPATAISYADSAVVRGVGYEYRVSKTAPSYGGEGYIYTGIEMPLVETRGRVVLIVANDVSTSLAVELTRLVQDLVGDGWTILRHDVPRMGVDPANANPSVWSARLSELAAVRNLLIGEFTADPVKTKAAFLFGHLPVPYSGALNPDSHPDHAGAWPADVFYADANGSWGDSVVSITTATDARNDNVPGDGKLDPSRFSPTPSLELQVGRVDFANLSSFSHNETELLRRYLNKNHNFRHRLVTVERRGLIDDELGLFGGEALAANGWRNFAPLIGANQTIAGDWFTVLAAQSYLWAYGCGAGTYTSCAGVVTTGQLAAGDPRVVFTMFFGSYFGDWDSPNNLMRSAIATPTYTLTSVWAGRPNWQFHHMALGETIGFSTLATENNTGTYVAGSFRAYVHMGLMGDPTLRMHPVGPPSALSASANGSGGVNLSWTASSDSVLGYHVYRAPAAEGPYTRVNGALINGISYTDSSPGSDVHYMVRAVKLEVSGSGSYYNASQGIFATVSSLPTPAAALTSSANPALPGQSVTFTATFSAVPPAVGVPTGTVQFRIDEANAGGPVALSGGVANYVTSILTHGTHTASADYSGDASFAPASADLAPDQVINTPPVAGADTVERDALSGRKVLVSALLSNDTDADSDPLSFVDVSATSTHGAALTRSGDWIFYTPLPGFTNPDTFTYTFTDPFGPAVVSTVSVNIRVDNGPSPNLTITDLGNGSYQVRGDGIPERAYRIQFTDSMSPPNWQTLATVPADPFGVFVYVDPGGSATRFYRSVWP